MNERTQDERVHCIGKHHHRGIGVHKTIYCRVGYSNGRWKVTVPGEGTASMRDSKQIRVIGAMLMNEGVSMEPDDIEDAASTGPVIIHGGRHAEDKPQPAHVVVDGEPLSESDGEVRPQEDGDASKVDDAAGDEVSAEKHDVHLALELTFKSSSDPDLLMGRGMKHLRHTGDAGDYRLVHDLDRRVAVLDGGIRAARARGDETMATALGDERAALRSWRNWYMNAVNGRLKPFYPKDVDDEAHRCRMWIVRGLQTLAAKGLPKAAVSLDSAISRGMEFIFRKQPGYEWIVIPPPPGSLPVFPKAAERDDGSEVAA